MRWTIRVIIIIAVLWVGYAAWPFWALYDLVNAVQNRDSAAVAQRVNFPAVRRSLTEQIAASYVQLAGKEARVGQLSRAVAVAAMTSFADPIVARLVTAEALIELLHKGWPASILHEEGTASQGLSSGSPGNFWQLFIHSEQGLRSFEVAFPATAPARLRLKLQFRLTNWTWKLAAVELPDELRVRLARELMKQIDRK
jgi:hypothetical protein